MPSYYAYPTGLIVIKEPGYIPGPEAVEFNHYPTRAEMIAIGVVYKRRRPLTPIMADIAALPNTDRNQLIAAVCADFLQNNPRFAEALGISISGDEDDT